MTDDNKGWNEWSKYVLKELHRLNEVIIEVSKELNNLKVEVGKLQVKASIWGGVTGAVTTLIGLAIYILKQG